MTKIIWKKLRQGKLKVINLSFGYNKPSNEAMLLDDGYLRYEGLLPVSQLKIENGVIIEQPISIPESKPHIFTKLQIRRAMRKLGVEDTLDSVISTSGIFASDWQDAQDIDLNDPIFSQAISSIGVDENFIETVIQNIE